VHLPVLPVNDGKDVLTAESDAEWAQRKTTEAAESGGDAVKGAAEDAKDVLKGLKGSGSNR
jgi:hypothetical protein